MHLSALILALVPLADSLPESVQPPELVPYAELAQAPNLYVGREVRLRLQFRALDFDWDPLLSRFGPSEYLAIGAWSDEQRLWLRADYEAPQARVFIDRLDPQAGLFLRAEPHMRFEATCVLREFLAGDIYVELTKVRYLPEYVPEGSQLHAIRAHAFMRSGSWDLAHGQFERALTAPVPERVRAEFERDAAECARQAARVAELRRTHRRVN